MEEDKKLKRIDFFLDVLKMVRLLALYFCLYFISIYVFTGTFLREQPKYVAFLSFAICGIVTFLFLPKDHKKLTFSCEKKGFALLGILLLSAGFTVFMNIAINYIPWDAFLPEEMQYTSENTFKIPLYVSIVGYGILAPFAEEVCFRGVLFKYLKKMIKAPFAIVLSALFFGLYHGNLMQGLYAFIMGLIMGFLVHKTDSIAASILFHMVSNLIVTLYANIPELYYALYSLPGVIVMGLCVVVGIVLLSISLSAKGKEEVKESEA